MLTLEELKDWFKDTQFIIFDSRICINNSIRLREITEDRDLRESELRMKEIYGFFNIHWFQCKFISVIQLSKLFSDSRSQTQKRSFYKLFNRLQNEKYDKDLTELLKANSNRLGNSYSQRKDILLAINNAKAEIKQFKDTIDGINNLRNKIYAHTDPDSNDAKNVVLTDTIELQKLAEKIWNEFNGGLFGSVHSFEMTVDWHIGGIIETIAKDYKRMLDECDEK